MLLIIVCICSVLISVATLLPLSHNAHWIVRGLDFPRLQIMSFILVLLGISVFILDFRKPLVWVITLTNSICLMWQLWWIAPYTPFWPKEVNSFNGNKTDNQLSIITANVLTTNRNADALLKLVNSYKPDVLITLESDQWWQDQLKVLELDMPYLVHCPLDNLYGMHLYSKLPLHEEQISFLVEKDVPSIHSSIELRSGHKIRAHFLHPAPPSPTENTESIERDAELVIVARSVEKSKQAVVVTGDLNDVAWSSTTRLFRKISGLLDPRIGRGMFNTFHASYPFLRWPLDHLFHSEHFTLCAIKRLPNIGSDHFPLYTRLSFSPLNIVEQKSQEEATDEQYERSRDIAAKKGVQAKDVPEPNE